MEENVNESSNRQTNHKKWNKGFTKDGKNEKEWKNVYHKWTLCILDGDGLEFNVDQQKTGLKSVSNVDNTSRHIRLSPTIWILHSFLYKFHILLECWKTVNLYSVCSINTIGNSTSLWWLSHSTFYMYTENQFSTLVKWKAF